MAKFLRDCISKVLLPLHLLFTLPLSLPPLYLPSVYLFFFPPPLHPVSQAGQHTAGLPTNQWHPQPLLSQNTQWRKPSQHREIIGEKLSCVHTSESVVDANITQCKGLYSGRSWSPRLDHNTPLSTHCQTRTIATKVVDYNWLITLYHQALVCNSAMRASKSMYALESQNSFD